MLDLERYNTWYILGEVLAMFFSQTDLGLTMSSSTITDVINQLNPYLQFIVAIITIVAVPKVVADFFRAIPHRKECQIPPSVI